MYDAVLAAQQAAVALVRPGTACAAVHAAAVEVFAAAGYTTAGTGTEFAYAEGFVHSVGHGVGTAVHEDPKLSSKSEDVLQVGDVVTIEPGLYYASIGGVRIEDLYVVTEDGFEQLTNIPTYLEI